MPTGSTMCTKARSPRPPVGVLVNRTTYRVSAPVAGDGDAMVTDTLVTPRAGATVYGDELTASVSEEVDTFTAYLPGAVGLLTEFHVAVRVSFGSEWPHTSQMPVVPDGTAHCPMWVPVVTSSNSPSLTTLN